MGKILIVDDERSVRKSFRIWLSSEGFEVLEAHNSETAIQAIKNSEVEIVLLDIRLGNEDGVELVEKLLKINSDLKIIMLTGYPSYDSAVQTIKKGAFDYVSKSENNEKILSLIEKALISKYENAKKIKVTLVCKHRIVQEMLEEVEKESNIVLEKKMDSLESLNEISDKESGIILICSICNFKDFNEALNKIKTIDEHISKSKLVLMNENYKESEKVDLIKAGVRGFFSVDFDKHTLKKGISKIYEGEIWASRRVLNLLINDVVSKDNTKAPEEEFELTSREIEIIKLLYLGLKNREIAGRLHISEKTVKTHITHILRKLSAKTRTEAVRIALENKII